MDQATFKVLKNIYNLLSLEEGNSKTSNFAYSSYSQKRMTKERTNIGFRPMQHVSRMSPSHLIYKSKRVKKKKWQFLTQHKVDGLEKQRKGLQFYTKRKLTIQEESLMLQQD